MNIKPKQKTHIQYDYRSARQRPEDITAHLVRSKCKRLRHPVMIAVGGPGGSGKSTFCAALRRALGDAEILSLDDYKTPREQRKKQRIMGPHPEANRMDLILEHIRALRKKKSIRKPVYCPRLGAARRTKLFAPARYIIVDGEVSTYPELHPYIDFSIFIDSDWKTQLDVRITRDIEVRNYSRHKAIETFLQSNLREFETFGAQTKQWTDVHLFRYADGRLVVESVDKKILDGARDALMSPLEPLRLRGLVCQVPTPFTKTNAIDEQAFIASLAHLSFNGVQRILIAGRIGEGWALTRKERMVLVELALHYFPGLVVLQVSSGAIEDQRAEIMNASEYGVDAAVVSLPRGVDVNTLGMQKYFTAIQKGAQIPLIADVSNVHPQFKSGSVLVEHGYTALAGDPSEDSLRSNFTVLDERICKDPSVPRGFFAQYAAARPDLYARLEHATNRTAQDILAKEIRALSLTFGIQPIALVKKALQRVIKKYPSYVRPPL